MLLILVFVVDSTEAQSDFERAKDYITENLNAYEVSFIEENGFDKIFLLGTNGKNKKVNIKDLDKNSLRVRNENDSFSDTYIIIECKKKKDAIRMSEGEELPRERCVKEKMNTNLGINKSEDENKYVASDKSIWIDVSFDETSSLSGARKAFEIIFSKSAEEESGIASKSQVTQDTGDNVEGEVIELEDRGGVFEAKVNLNGVVKIDMIIDSGASEVSISPDVASTLIRSGTVEDDDWLDSKTYVFADGSRAESKRFNLDTIEIGGHKIHNVAVSISKDIESPLLLGQNVLSRLGEVTFDYDNSRIIIE